MLNKFHFKLFMTLFITVEHLLLSSWLENHKEEEMKKICYRHILSLYLEAELAKLRIKVTLEKVAFENNQAENS